MSDSNLSEFMSITGCSDANRAAFFLDSSGGDVSAAVISFFESGGNEAEIPAAPPAVPATPEEQSQARLGTVSMQPGLTDDQREFYVGGEQSGLQVDKKETPEDKDNFINDLFKRAKDSGATEERSREQEERFIGSGYKLGGDGIESSVIKGNQARQPPKDIRLVLWKEGFALDDEPLRRYDDPANKTFLDQITKGELPTELRHLGREVNVSMEDRRNDEYEENKPKIDFKPFGGGGGNRLGAEGTSAGPSTSATVTSPVSTPVAKTVSINVDQSQPTTKLRFRLCSGKQVVQEFNQSHSVSDLRSFCAPHAAGREFELRAGFPPKPLDLSSTQSLKDAKLLNETVIQRLL